MSSFLGWPHTSKRFPLPLAANTGRKSKVRDLDPAVHPQENVVGLEIPVDDLLLVEELNALEHLLGHRGYLCLGQNCVEDNICEGSSVHKLHHHHERVILLEKFLTVDKIWMIQLSHHLVRMIWLSKCVQMIKNIHHYLCQKMILPLAIRYSDGFDSKLFFKVVIDDKYDIMITQCSMLNAEMSKPSKQIKWI